MTLEEAKKLLSANNIPFELVEYSDEKDCKVIAIVIKSNNGKKDIELQCNGLDGIFTVQNMYFGNLSFDLFEADEEEWAEIILSYIKNIQEGKGKVITANNIEKNCWLWDTYYDLSCDESIFGKKEFEEDLAEIYGSGPVAEGIIGKILDRLLRTKIQYEIYDWNTYQCIIKE